MAHRLLTYYGSGVAAFLVVGCLPPITCEDTLSCENAAQATEDEDAGEAEGGAQAAPQISATGVEGGAATASPVQDAEPPATVQDAGEDASVQQTEDAATRVDASQNADSGRPDADAGDACVEACSVETGPADACANCAEHADCVNTSGVVTCECEEGYFSDGETCTAPPSCLALPANCGGTQGQSCCSSPAVPAGSFVLGDPRLNGGGTSPATISAFSLDKYEVTVGRFREFAASYLGPPTEGSGAHPLIANSGWNADWNTSIAKTATELVAAVQCSFLDQTWDETGANDWLPMNCVSWYEAFAFCAWDGGRLPTEAEWEYAAAGGEDERVYPWGNSSPLTSLVVYGCQGDEKSGCTLADIPPVGSFATGVGKYGQLDMAGSMREWVLDWYAQSYSTPCNDCANVVTGQSRVSRGGDWYYNAEYLRAAYRSYEDHASHFNYMGLRCARNLP